MGEDRFAGKGIDEIMKVLGIEKDEEPEKRDFEQEVLDYLRKAEAKSLQQAYDNALEQVGDDLEYSSAKHIFAVVFGLIPDLFSVLQNPIKGVLQSEEAKRLVIEAIELQKAKSVVNSFIHGDGMFGDVSGTKEDMENDKDYDSEKDENLADYVVRELTQALTAGKEPEKAAELKQDIETVVKGLKRRDSYVVGLAKICEDRDVIPEQITEKEDVGVVQNVYGSLEEYERLKHKQIKGLSKLIGLLDKAEDFPYEQVLSVVTLAKTGKEAKEYGIDLGFFGHVVQIYIGDLTKFGKAFLTEIAKQTARQIQKYKALAAE